MKNIQVLDCTLRDGGRIINCAFPDKETVEIAQMLTEAKIDIIEVGFLRDSRNVEYKGNSTFFTSTEQIAPFIPQNRQNSMYVAFVDYGMYDFETLLPYDGTSVDGIRVGFTKKDFIAEKDEIIKSLNVVKERGYKLFIQGVNSLGYTDKELLEIVDMVNVVHPYSFGLVDTYGAMYVDDVRRLYDLIDHNMHDDICIDFHSHNNFQLSFSFAQEIIELSKGVRNVIIDATLNGMGKCAGNLNTELIVDYLVRKRGYVYDFDMILDIIDEHIYMFKESCGWGYSIPAVMAGIYKSHPNNVIYLTEKYSLSTKDVKAILSMIDPERRQRYDYDNIQNLYKIYNHTKVDDRAAIEKLHSMLDGRNLLLLMPGNSIVEYSNDIDRYICERNAFVISANYVTDKTDRKNRLAFFGNDKRYKHSIERKEEDHVAVVSNVLSRSETDIVINYESLIDSESEYFDNTTIMLLNLLRKLNITEFAIAGFDGYVRGGKNYFNSVDFDENRFKDQYEKVNASIRKMLKKYAAGLEKPDNIEFLTPSIFSKIFNRK